MFGEAVLLSLKYMALGGHFCTEINNLIHTVTQTLKLSHKGAHATRKTQLATIRLVIDDLISLRCALHHWQELSGDQVRKLISYWQTKQIKTQTIAKRVSILRKVCSSIELGQSFPSNKALGLRLPSPKQTTNALFDAILDKIEHPITKSIVELEIYFGLTKSEAIRLSEHSIDHSSITIYRDIAYNHYDRIILVITQEQRNILINRRQLITKFGGQESLLQIASFSNLSALYRCELAILKIKGHSHFREIYAKKRFIALEKANTGGNSIAILQKELGLNSSRLLRRWVK